jgi:hypothetical protein
VWACTATGADGALEPPPHAASAPLANASIAARSAEANFSLLNLLFTEELWIRGAGNFDVVERPTLPSKFACHCVENH